MAKDEIVYDLQCIHWPQYVQLFSMMITFIKKDLFDIFALGIFKLFYCRFTVCVKRIQRPIHVLFQLPHLWHFQITLYNDNRCNLN